MMKKVCGHFFPRSFYERSRYHGFCMVFSLFMTSSTRRNNIFNMLAYSRSRHTDSHALSRHWRIPWWPKWSFPRISNRSDDGTISRETDQKISLGCDVGEFSFDISGHPSIQNSYVFCILHHLAGEVVIPLISARWLVNFQGCWTHTDLGLLDTYRFRSS